jgi:hypothetical protein
MRLDSNPRVDPASVSTHAARAALSREDATSRVEGCRSWAELFDAANLALSSDRSRWGDALEPSCAAFSMWRSAAFVVAASKHIEMDTLPDGSTMSAEGIEVSRASFACAKALATRMLAPLAIEPGEGFGEWRSFERACSLAKGDMEQRLSALRKNCLIGKPLSLAMPTPKGQCINLMVGTACWIALDDPKRILQKSALISWEALEDSACLDFPAHPGAARLERAQAQNHWKAALESGPFSYLACGPQGGASQAGAQADKLARAAKLFSEELGSHGMPILGLAGLGAYVNARPVGEFASAAFENCRFDLVFKAPFHPTYLHHEWTHALDQMTSANAERFPQAAEALRLLKQEMVSGARDERVLSSEISSHELLEQSSLDALRECSIQWSTAVEQNASTRGLPVVDAKALALAAFDSASQAADPAYIGFLPSVQSLWSSPTTPAMDMALSARANQAMAKTRSSRRSLGSLYASREGEATSFLAVARALDASNPDSAGYWTHEPEMLARSGEGRFCHLLPSTLASTDGRIIFSGKLANEHPLGAERERLSRLYNAWLRACGPMVSQAAFEREQRGVLPKAPAHMMKP